MRAEATCARQALALPERNQAEHIVGRNLLRQQRRHVGRKRLRRRELLAFGAALRHGAFLHRPYRLAGIAVEHEHKSLLGRLDHDVARALAGIDARQRRLRRQIVIPDIVMHGLKRPDPLAGLGAQRHDRIGVVVVAGPLAAPEIRARRRRRQEHQAAFLVHRHRRPDIGMAGDDAIMHQRIEAPARTPGSRIEGAHRAGWRLDAAVVRDRRADDDGVADNDGGRRDLEFAGPFQRRAGLELDLAIGAEIGAGNAGPRVERDHPRVVGTHQDSRAAGGGPGRLVVDPIGHAAAIVAVGRALRGRDLRIVPPFLRAAAGIERDHFVERRAEDQAVFDQQRRGLKLGPLHHLGRAGVEIAGAKLPGADEIADIVRRDLVERRKPRSAAIAAPMLPGGSRKRDTGAEDGNDENEQTNRISHPAPASAMQRLRDRLPYWHVSIYPGRHDRHSCRRGRRQTRRGQCRCRC